jgi:DNA repair protein RadC
MRGLEHEVFACAFLDSRHRLIAYDEMFRSTIDGASVHPREVVKKGLKHNAAAVLLAHNHPSGVACASRSDEEITHRLKECLRLVDIRVLDHIIVAGGGSMSFVEKGILEQPSWEIERQKALGREREERRAKRKGTR